MKPVYILWEDCVTLDMGPWSYWQEWDYTPCYVHTLGFLLKETEEAYIITESYREDMAQTGPVIQIPKRMVLQYTSWDEI